MNCDDVRISLGVYVLGALDPEETAEVEAHLDTCPACRAELAELSGLPAVLGRVSEQDIEVAAAPPPVVLERLIAASARRGRRSRTMLALAASVVVAALGGTAWLSAARPAQDASVAAGSAAASSSTTAADSGGVAPRDQKESAERSADQPVAIQPYASGTGAARPPAASSQPDAAARETAPQETAARPSPDAAASSSEVQTFTTAEAPPVSEARGRSGDVTLAVRLTAKESGTDLRAMVSGVPAGTTCTLRVIGPDGTATTVGSWPAGPGEHGPGKNVFEGSTSLSAGDIRRLELVTSDGRTVVTTSAPSASASGSGSGE
ncbi:zf-HC2 domain-containing protein [Sphaerimonospora mesophila]|uniref:anti-sigma factor family protein n=1 Tax=Sphaerimonospora mesophila TaxID=37483 RepID=UPI0006E36DE7